MDFFILLINYITTSYALVGGRGSRVLKKNFETVFKLQCRGASGQEIRRDFLTSVVTYLFHLWRRAPDPL